MKRYLSIPHHSSTRSKEGSVVSTLSEDERAKLWLKRGVWLYFILLITEGALRKWVFPSLSQPLLIIRDPLAIAMLLYAWYTNLLPNVRYVNWMFFIGIISSFASLFIGHGNIFVTLFGARILLVHFPLIFLIGKVFNAEDVRKMGKVVLWISMPMAVLIAMQFFSPQSAWVNIGVGGEEGGGFSGAMGYARPPGTFSFTNGTTLFFSLVGCYVLYFWLKSDEIKRVVLIGATVALLVAIPFSISRGLTFTLVIMFIFMIATLTRNPNVLGKIFMSVLGFTVLIFILGMTGILDTPLEVFIKRFENAKVSEGGLEGTLIDRYLGGMVKAITRSGSLPFFGVGIGMGTNFGSILLSGERTFLVSEGEWGRIIGEMGALLGMAVIFIRLAISVKLTLKSYVDLRRGNMLSWMLLSFAILVFPQGQWAQPTSLGFSTLITGLLIASFNKVPEPKMDSEGIIEVNSSHG